VSGRPVADKHVAVPICVRSESLPHHVMILHIFIHFSFLLSGGRRIKTYFRDEKFSSSLETIVLILI
jgi:hypothetical protein